MSDSFTLFNKVMDLFSQLNLLNMKAQHIGLHPNEMGRIEGLRNQIREILKSDEKVAQCFAQVLMLHQGSDAQC